MHCMLDVQPHWPAMHSGPGLQLVVQLRHMPPELPHSALAVPTTHAAPSQQPPLQAVSFAPPQATVQVWVVVLHASPGVAVAVFAARQSVGAAQPHEYVGVLAPFDTHAEPAAEPVQLVHAPE